MRDSLHPNKEVIGEFIAGLGRDLDGLGYFEIRMLHPNPTDDQKRVISRWITTAGATEGVQHVSHWNQRGYNAYIIPNPLRIDHARPGHHATSDAEVMCATHHFLDADSDTNINTLLDMLQTDGLIPSMVVTTGTVPSLRMHVYFRTDDLITDLGRWGSVQAGLAKHFGTDGSVTNASRLMRLPGTISYPPPKKLARGYVIELTHLDTGSDVTISTDALYDTFPAPVKTAQPVQPATVTDDGPIPLCVIEAALQAIPPIAGTGRHNEHLEIACACKGANAGCEWLFTAWQKLGNYHAKHAGVWRSCPTPTANSHLGLFKHAKRADPDWWRANPDCEQWWRDRASIQAGELTPMDRIKRRIEWKKSRKHTTD